MTQVVTRTYQSQEQAMDVARELLNSGVPRERLHLLVYQGGADGGDDQILGELSNLGLTHDEARDSVKSLKDGRTLLTARMPDIGGRTSDILDRRRPVDTERGAYDEADAAPLSHALHAKILSDDPAPLSHALHIPVLSEGHGATSRLEGGVSNNPAPLSRLLHIPVLTGD